MIQKYPAIPFSSFLYVALAGHLIYGIPAIGAILLFNFMPAAPLFFVFGFITLVEIPLSAAFGWLVAKGSNWVNLSPALIVVSIMPSRLFSILLGGLLGARLFATVGGIVGTVGGIAVFLVVYAAVRAASIPIGKFVTQRILLRTRSAKG